jgi:hypothetical protein
MDVLTILFASTLAKQSAHWNVSGKGMPSGAARPVGLDVRSEHYAQETRPLARQQEQKLRVRSP